MERPILMNKVKIFTFCFLVVILFGESVFGQEYPGLFLKQSTIYYSWSYSSYKNRNDLERAIVLNHNNAQTYESVSNVRGYVHYINGHWKESGDTLTLYPSIYLCLSKNGEWEVEDNKDNLFLKPTSFLKLDTGELKQLPWEDEDYWTNEVGGNEWDGLKRLYGPFSINLNINVPED